MVSSADGIPHPGSLTPQPMLLTTVLPCFLAVEGGAKAAAAFMEHLLYARLCTKPLHALLTYFLNNTLRLVLLDSYFTEKETEA